VIADRASYQKKLIRHKEYFKQLKTAIESLAPIDINTTLDTFEIRKIRGRGLLACDIGGSSDPFMVISVANQKEKLITPVLPKTLTPFWMTRWDIRLTLDNILHDKLHIEVRMAYCSATCCCFAFFMVILIVSVGLVQMWDKDTITSNDFMGEADVSFRQIIEEGILYGRILIPLCERSGKKESKKPKSYGEVQLTIRVNAPIYISWLCASDDKDNMERGLVVMKHIEDCRRRGLKLKRHNHQVLFISSFLL
jgi:hypothetical protein